MFRDVNKLTDTTKIIFPKTILFFNLLILVISSKFSISSIPYFPRASIPCSIFAKVEI